MTRFAHALATVFGLGDRLPAPGTTAGSLPAVAAWWAATTFGRHPELVVGGTLVAAAIASVAGWWAAEVEARRLGIDDPGPVVIDEVAGQWLTLALGAAWAPALTPAMLAVAGFVLFRIFDIVKPFPVNLLERLPGGLGIMVDDLAAAGYAGLSLVLLARLVS